MEAQRGPIINHTRSKEPSVWNTNHSRLFSNTGTVNFSPKDRAQVRSS
ncbi:uncharacterized protein G2W53_040736 [Senna tora]|uniref:Uncharacterized protein n=1 Tax=Senna tora TaxID=362788 RepID=A0A834SCQ8_9FABA|nr:uncharacterized protein G2W53_040736 [Senna tora]